MPRIGTVRLLAASALLAIAAGESPGAGVRYEVAAPSVEVHDAPDDAAFASGRLARGAVVRAVGSGGPGWLAIEPPPGSFGWVEAEAVEATGPGRGRVRLARATIRSGRDGALLPGPPLAQLPAGSPVRLLDRAPLVVETARGPRRFRAVAPTEGERRFVRSEGLRPIEEGDEPAGVSDTPPAPPTAEPLPTPAPSPSLDPALRATQAEGPPEVAADLAGVDATIRVVLLGPIESWAFGGVRAKCRTLLERASGAEARAAVQARLDRIDQLADLAASAREFQGSVGRSRARDGRAGGLAVKGEPGADPFDEEGLLQTSSRMHRGQLVAALIGRDGRLRAYVEIPPGMDGTRFYGRRVGVRGPVRYVESLRAPLITAREVEYLDVVP